MRLRRDFQLFSIPLTPRCVIVGSGAVRGQATTALTIYDGKYRPRAEFAFDPAAGHVVHRCREYPAGGLHLIRVWEPGAEAGTFVERDVRAENIRIGPRDA